MRWLWGMVAWLLLVAAPALADSWMPAERKTYLSDDKGTRLTVFPRDLESPLAYFSDKVDGNEPAGQHQGGEPRARGVLERRAGGKWVTVWQAPLVNEVSPVSALVANGGAYVVTFDNWHSTGFGDNVVVIYRADGSRVRSLSLTDVLPEDYVRALPRSVSSLWWSGEHALSRDARQLVLKVVVPNGEGSIGSPRGYVDVAIDLATGTVTPPSGPAWDQAQAAAAPLAAASKAEEAERRALFLAPLTAPKEAERNKWSRYLYQAASRLAPAKSGNVFDMAWILPAPGAADFADQAKNIRATLSGGDGEGDVIASLGDEKSDLAFASPASPAALAQVLKEGAAAAPRGRLAGSRLFVAMPLALAAEVRAALAPTGATVIVFDPAEPIPQRAEALAKEGVTPDEAEAEAARLTAEARRLEEEAKRLEALAPPKTEPKSADSLETEEMEEMADQLEDEAERADKAAAAPKGSRLRTTASDA